MAFMVYLLHAMAVRSGLLAFYMALLYAAVRYMVTQRRGLRAMAIVTGALLLFVGSFYLVPSMRIKSNYMLYEWSRYMHGETGSGFGNDIGRLRSYTVGATLYKRHLLWGTGIGDIDDSTHAVFAHKYPQAPPEQYFSAHNQYLFVLTALGSIWGGLYIICLFIPLFNRRAWHDPLFACFQIILLMSFIFEAPMQEQAGLTIYWFFTLLIHNYINRLDAR
jgi:hypothetical protein